MASHQPDRSGSITVSRKKNSGANSRIAQFIASAIDRSGKTQREIAQDLGYERANIISMFKNGETKIPLDKVPDLAASLDLDATHLARLWFEQYWPDRQAVIAQMFGNVVSDREMQLVKVVRECTGDTNPPLTDEHVLALRGLDWSGQR